eukprot:2094393-Pleurochrysis_carterae.AAC.1
MRAHARAFAHESVRASARACHLHAHLPDEDGGHLHTRVDRGTYRPAERVPDLVIEPFEKGGEAVLRQVLGRAEVEPRVELVDHVAARGSRAGDKGQVMKV